MDHPNLFHKNSRTIIKFLLSLSLFSLLFSFLPLLLQSLQPFLSQFFNFTITKTHMFLLCNGLLVLILLVTASSSTTTTQHFTETPEIGISEFKELDTAASISQQIGVKAQYPEEEEEEEEEKEREESLVMADLQKEDEVAYTQKEEEEEEEEEEEGEKEEEEERNAVMIMEEDEEEKAEELNKKCEDFIRKMKAGFCSERTAYYFNYHQKTLVAVM